MTTSARSGELEEIDYGDFLKPLKATTVLIYCFRHPEEEERYPILSCPTIPPTKKNNVLCIFCRERWPHVPEAAGMERGSHSSAVGEEGGPTTPGLQDARGVWCVRDKLVRSALELH